MKIRFTNKYGNWNTAHTGKGKFAQRLIDEWQRTGVEVTQDVNEPVDIDLQIQRFVYEPRHANKIVLRVGPAEYDTNTDYEARNKEMRHCQKRAHGIIYQSQFAEKAHRSLVLDHHKAFTIIHNGADPRFYETLEPWATEFSVNFLASTREWVWEKRLTDLIEAFKVANVPDSCLWILGETWEAPKRFPPFQKGIEKRLAANNIRFMGGFDDAGIGRFYRMATCMLHAVYIDACPNAVAEAVCAGCNVLATNVGGQTELVNTIVPCDPPWDFKPRNRRRVPALDIPLFAAYMSAMPATCLAQPKYGGVDIRNVASAYVDFFRSLLGE